MRRIARGARSSLPPQLLLHMVAATYGQSPAAVRAWPAPDYLEAAAMISATRTWNTPGGTSDD